MKTAQKIGFILGVPLATAILLTACGSDRSQYSPPVAAALPPAGLNVPANASTSVDGFIAYLMGLNTADETSEPSPIANIFAVPNDETNDPKILG